MNQARRERTREKKRRQQLKSRLLWGGIGLVVIVLIAAIVYKPPPPPAQVGEESFPIMNANHIPDGTDPGEYNSDPPTSGPHYAEDLPGGFYEESDLAQYSPYPVGYVVHSLEHGFIIFWYNCDVITESECSDLKTQLQTYLDDSSNKKLIAFPWKSTDVPLVLTSWGKRLEMPVFDRAVAKAFIDRNRLNAPEPNAP